MYIVIAGGGKVGEYLATVLLEGGNEVAIIERNTEIADRLSMILNGRYLVIRGDGCDSKYQEDAGIHKADVFVAATGQDDNNLVSCEIAQRVFDVPRVVARVNAPKNQNIFRTLGIESVSSTELIANLIEEETLMGSVGVISLLTRGNISLAQVTVPRMRAHSNKEGVSVAEIDMPEGSIITAVQSADGLRVASDDAVLLPGDKAIVMADIDALDEVRDVFHAL